MNNKPVTHCSCGQTACKCGMIMFNGRSTIVLNLYFEEDKWKQIFTNSLQFRKERHYE